jgi:deoxynucleoside triphosphate triphosphohydrolase SAMHD1
MWKVVNISSTNGSAVISKSIKYRTIDGLKEQLVESFGLGAHGALIELMDNSGTIVALADLDDGGSYYVPSYADICPDIAGAGCWSSSRLWQTKDPIHDMIALPDFCQKIIDTPEFQRLRDVKQLGACSLVYVGAHHTRFEHCIGTAQLAFKMASNLKIKQPELRITSIDVLCVTIAGLCHDLGHGPFSHVWDDLIFPLVGVPAHHKHEDNSIALFKTMMSRLKSEDSHLAGLSEQDITFIQAMIHAPKGMTDFNWDSDLMGRERDKRFLFEIVSNKRSGLDVDKFDYIQRDCHNTGVKGVFEIDRVILNATVKECEGALQICWPSKEIENLYEVFSTRESLHRRVYQHRVAKSAEGMIRDIFVLVAPHMKVQADSGKWLSFQEAQTEPSAYLHLSDWLVQLIAHGPHVKIDFDQPDVKKAKQIIEDIRARKMWKFVGTTNFKGDMTAAVIAGQLAKCSKGKLPAEEWEIRESVFSWGMGNTNPIENVRFVNKHEPKSPMKLRPEDASKMLPSAFKEQKNLIFIKRTDPESRLLALEAFKQWCSEHNIEPITHDESVVSFTRCRKRALSDGDESEQPTPQKRKSYSSRV